MALEVGDRVGDYEIVQVLGAGGMGKVYKVRNLISDRFEAMKVLLPNLESDPGLADRFLREIKLQAALSHPNIAGLHTALRVDNQLLMFIEFVEGKSLDSILKQYGQIPAGKAADFICQVLEALSYAHERGVIHRDIKPANIMLTPQGVVKLMDFGIAKSADRSLTQTGRTVGSLYYMSPEQINGSQMIDGRADLYSLGISLYELVTGKRPFEGDSDYSIMAGHLHQPPVPPVEIDPAVPAAINDVILMAIGKDPAIRFQSAAAFRNALAAAAGLTSAEASPAAIEPQTPAPVAVTPEPEPVNVKPGSSRTLYMLVGSVATLVVLGLVVTQAPRFFRTKADQASQSVTAPAPTSPPVQEPAPAQPEPTVTPAPAVVQSSPQPAPDRTAAKPSPASQQPATATVTQQTSAVPPPQETAAPTPSPSPPKTSDAQPTVPSPPADGNRAALRELRERSMMLATRIGSLKPSLDTLRREQAASGLSLRGDISQAWQRIEYFMDEADDALKAGNPDDVKKNLDQAERQVEIVEKFLGR